MGCRYEFRFLGAAGDTTALRWCDFADDRGATNYALGLLTGYAEAAQVEVRTDARQVLNYRRATPLTPDEMRHRCLLALDAAAVEPDWHVRHVIQCWLDQYSRDPSMLPEQLEQAHWRRGGQAPG